jgi:hypothetical protein
MAQVGVDIGSYTFDASAKTITFVGVGLTTIEQIKPIINGTRNTDIFNPLTVGKFGTLAGQVLTLDFDTTLQADTDKLYICVNLVDAELASEATQLLIKAVLDGIDTKLPQLTLNGDSLKVYVNNQIDLTTITSYLLDIKNSVAAIDTNTDGIEGLITDTITAINNGTTSINGNLSDIITELQGLDANTDGLEQTLSDILAKIIAAPATEANQTNGNQKTQITDGAGTVNTKQLGVQLTNADVGLVTNTVIHGLTTGGGGGYVDVKVNPSGALTVESTISGTVPLPTGASTSALQTTGNTSLSNINTKLPSNLTVTANRLLTDGSGVTQPVSIASPVTVTGALTDAELRASPVPVSLTSTTVTNTVAVSAAALPLPSGAATAANQTTLGNQTTKLNDGTNTATVKAASTSPIATDTALVVSISPNSASIPVALPTGASTLTEQQSQTLQLNELVSLFSSKLRDAAGRIRVSEPTSLGDYKILNNTFDALQLQQVGTGTFTQNANRTTMAVTSSQYAIVQTKQYHPYLNQKSQEWTMTFTEMGAATNVEKSIGYISSNAVAPFNSNLDGMRIFKDVSNNYFLQVWRNGTKILDIARTSWNDKLDGTGASGMTINWVNFNVMGADFLYLGGTAIAFKIMNGRMPVIFHVINYANTDTQPIFLSPNKPLRWEIRSTTGSGNMNMICGNVNSEGELKGLGNAITIKGSAAGFTAPSTGVAYAIAGVRKKSTFRDIAAMIDVFEATASSNDYFEVSLILNPTIAGTVTWADVANTPLQSFQGVAANVVTGGLVIANTYASQNMNNARGVENVLARLNSTITDVMDIIVVCVTPSLGSTNVLSTGSMQVRWIT